MWYILSHFGGMLFLFCQYAVSLLVVSSCICLWYGLSFFLAYTIFANIAPVFCRSAEPAELSPVPHSTQRRLHDTKFSGMLEWLTGKQRK
jgi:uncharacterized membrane protein YhaH (DUF805 family)